MKGDATALVLPKANKLKLQKIPYDAAGPGGLLVQTIASTITPGLDRLLLTNKPISHKVLDYPLIPGSEAIGQVVAAGPETGGLQTGDFVYVSRGSRWIGTDVYYGCHAELIPTSRDNVLPLRRQPVHRDLLTGLLAYVISAVEKVITLGISEPILILGLGSVGLMVSEYLHHKGFRHVDAVETFGIRGQLSRAARIALEIEDFTPEFNDRYDLVIETTGRILMVEKAVRLMKQQARVLLMGNYEVMGYDHRLIQHKEPAIFCSSVTAKTHLEIAARLLETEELETEKFFTNVFPANQFEMAYRMALDSKESIKTIISWI